MKRKRTGRDNQKAVVAAVCAAIVLVAVAGGYFVLIGPERSKLAEIDRQIESTEQTIASYRAQSQVKTERIRFAELFALTKAMPDQEDVPGVLLELSGVASDTGITIQSVVPAGAKTSGTSYYELPLEVVIDGNFYDVSDFLYRLRTVVSAHDGRLSADGRLFAVQSIQFAEGLEKFPELQAKLTLAAFVYGVPAATAGTPAPPAATPAPSAPADSGASGAPTAVGATN